MNGPLTPEERAALAAQYGREAAMGEAWGREHTTPAVVAQSAAIAAMAGTTQQFNDRYLESEAKLRAWARTQLVTELAGQIFVDRTSSLDTDGVKIRQAADFSVLWAKYILQAAERA